MWQLPTPILWICILALLAVFPFFFVGTGGGQSTSPDTGGALGPAIWNLGHGGYFALFTLVWLHIWPARTLGRGWVVTVVVLALGLTIEIVQLHLGRSFALADIWRNLVGAWTVLAFWPGVARAQPWKAGLRWVVAALIVVELSQWVLPVVAEVRLNQQVPILFDPTAPDAQAYWEGPVRRAGNNTQEFRNAIQIELGTSRYSGVNLVRLPSDWRGYQALTFRLYNPVATELMLSLRIDDRAHDQEAPTYTNRFNARLAVSPGWNEYRFALADIADAPDARRMDMHQITRLGIFATELEQSRQVWLADLRLQ